MIAMGILVEAEVNKLGSEVKSVLKTAPTSRIYFLDNLKILLAVLVVLDHAAQPYGPGGCMVIASEPAECHRQLRPRHVHDLDPGFLHGPLLHDLCLLRARIIREKRRC